MRELILLFVWLSRWAKAMSHLRLLTYDEWLPGKKLKLLLVGYNGARNTGADARVVALVDQLQEEFGKDNVEITVMTLNPALVQGYFPADVHILPFPTFFCWALLRACSSHHAAVLCEGSTLTHTFADALSLFFCQAAGIMKRQGKPCIAYGSEVGKLKPALENISRKMCRDTYFMARSQASLQNLKQMGLQSHLGTDTAWTLQLPQDHDKGRELLVNMGWNSKSRLLGVAVINPFCWPVRFSVTRWVKAMLTNERSLQYDNMFFFSDSEERRNKYNHYLDELAKVIRTYRQKENAFVVLLGMERLDKQACLDLMERVGDCAVITSDETPVFHMLSVLRKLDVLVTSRYHAALLSMGNCIPMVAVSMDSRLDGLFRDFGFSEDYLLPVDEKDLALRVLHGLTLAEDHRAEDSRLKQQQIKRNIGVLKEMGTFAHQWIMNQLKQTNR